MFKNIIFLVGFVAVVPVNLDAPNAEFAGHVLGNLTKKDLVWRLIQFQRCPWAQPQPFSPSAW